MTFFAKRESLLRLTRIMNRCHLKMSAGQWKELARYAWYRSKALTQDWPFNDLGHRYVAIVASQLNLRKAELAKNSEAKQAEILPLEANLEQARTFADLLDYIESNPVTLNQLWIDPCFDELAGN